MSIGLQTVTVTQDGLANCTFTMTPTTPEHRGRRRRRHVHGEVQLPVAGQQRTWIGSPWVPAARRTFRSTTRWQPNTCVAIAHRNHFAEHEPARLHRRLPSPRMDRPTIMTLDPSSATVGAAASQDRITVTTGDTCNWSASTDVNWIQITFGATGTGSGGISYQVLENTTAQRTGSIHVGALTYTITQQAPGLPAPVLSSVTQCRQLQRRRGLARGDRGPVRHQHGSVLDRHAAGE